MRKGTTLIYLNDKRRPRLPLLRLVGSHVVEILIALKNSVYNRKENEKKKFKGEIHINAEGDENHLSSLIIYEAFLDYDIHTSKQVCLYSDISPENPVCILSTNYPLRSNKISFSIFLHKQMKWIKSISVKGYINHKMKDYFSLSISGNRIRYLSETTYWLDIILDMSEVKIKNHTKRIDIYLTEVAIESIKKPKIMPPWYAISPDIPSNQISKKQRPVFILSFDAITTEDIYKERDICRSINSFADENFWFKNAIASSAVTASSAASLMTGLNLARHFMYIYKTNYLSPDLKILSYNIKTLGEKVRSVGMHSYGLFSFGKWSPNYGYARGFSEYKNITAGNLLNYPWLDESIKKISNNNKNSCLFAMHHLGGHPPFVPAVTTPYFDQEYSLYHNNLAIVDRFFGQLMHYLKDNDLYSDALIILLADHGRSLSSLKKSNDWHFLENRIRIPLIIKNPDWNMNGLNEYNVNSHVSVQTMVHEVVLEFLGISSFGNQDLKYRTIDDISWVSETVDYRRMNDTGDTRKGFIGLVGYDDEYKYTIYFSIDFESFIIKKSSNLARYQLNKFGIAEDKVHDLTRSENIRITDSAFEYLKRGLLFAKKNQPEQFGYRTSKIDIIN